MDSVNCYQRQKELLPCSHPLHSHSPAAGAAAAAGAAEPPPAETATAPPAGMLASFPLPEWDTREGIDLFTCSSQSWNKGKWKSAEKQILSHGLNLSLSAERNKRLHP